MSAERTRVAAHAMPTPIAAAAAEAPISANASTLTDTQFAVPNHLQGGTITRHFMINFRGSLSDMADSPSRASWAPTEHSIFQSKTRYAPNATKSQVRQGNLRQAILIGMKASFFLREYAYCARPTNNIVFIRSRRSRARSRASSGCASRAARATSTPATVSGFRTSRAPTRTKRIWTKLLPLRTLSCVFERCGVYFTAFF